MSKKAFQKWEKLIDQMINYLHKIIANSDNLAEYLFTMSYTISPSICIVRLYEIDPEGIPIGENQKGFIVLEITMYAQNFFQMKTLGYGESPDYLETYDSFSGLRIRVSEVMVDIIKSAQQHSTSQLI